jgi:hypothetical protein
MKNHTQIVSGNQISRKAISFLTVVLFCMAVRVQTIAQTISASDMVAMGRCASFDCYNSTILNRGFHFESSEYIEGVKAYKFLSDELFRPHDGAIVQIGTCITFSLEKQKERKHWTAFCSYYKPHAQQLFDQFEEMGFKEKPGSSEASGTKVVTIYTSTQYPMFKLNVEVEHHTVMHEGETEEFNSYVFTLDTIE